MIWGQSEVRAHGRHLLLVLSLPTRGKKGNTLRDIIIIIIIITIIIIIIIIIIIAEGHYVT